MPEWSGKSRGGFAGYKIFVLIIKYFGISAAYFTLRFVVLYFFIFAPRAVKYSYFYLNKRQGFLPVKSLWYVGRMFYKLGQVLIDKVAFLSGSNTQFTFDFDGEEHLRKMAETTGGILIGLHAGNWEVAGHLLQRMNTKVHIVVFANEHQQIQGLLANINTRQNLNFIVVNRDYSHLFQISKALEKHEIVAIHGDRFLPGTRTATKTFFYANARFPYGPFLLPVKFNVPVSFVAALKASPSHYHLYATESQQYNKPNTLSDRDDSVDCIMDNFINFAENILVKYPDQWFNFYDFWEDNKRK